MWIRGYAGVIKALIAAVLDNRVNSHLYAINMQNMKNTLRLLCLALSLLSADLLTAQNERPLLTLRLKNGDVITGISEISSITYRTAYGDLAFPIKDVATITLGVNTYGVDKKQVFDIMDNIQNSPLNDASIYFDRLTKMEPGVIPYVREYIEAPSYRRREGSDLSIDLAYEILLSRYSLTKAFKVKDVLQTNGATSVEGNYEFESLSLETDYGRLSVSRTKINSISVTMKDVNNAGAGNFKLNANQHIAGNTNGGWVNTGILVKKDQTIKITASGQVNIASLSNNAYTPDGGVNGSPGPKGGEPSYGNVVFKIGEAGQTLKAGDNYSGRAAMTGIIYISIFESVYNAANSGSYMVKVSVN
jgi:hypothetical protein